MARRRPITSHPAFAPLIALWLAALLGLIVAVLPAAVLEGVLVGLGFGALTPLALALRLVLGALAASVGGLIGYALARRHSSRAGDDPRPVYAEAEPEPQELMGEAPARRPLRVREELADGLGDESQVSSQASAHDPLASPEKGSAPFVADAQAPDGFMILTPQPIHPPLPSPDLETLLEQFDSAFAAFRSGEGKQTAAPDSGQGADPVQAFVARQTGAPGLSPAPSPMGGLVPDHQAELRAALDKLARSQRGE